MIRGISGDVYIFPIFFSLTLSVYSRSDTNDLNRAFTGEACSSGGHTSGDSGRSSRDSTFGITTL